MLMEVDEAIRLTSVVSLRREKTAEMLNQVRELVRVSDQAIEESRKLLAANDILLGTMLRCEISPPPLSHRQLEDLAQMVAKARGGYAFVWNPNDAFPLFNSTASAAIQ
jgi:hypothetical protein